MGKTRSRYRYHLILGDGHRSQFNLALQFGATALALKAIFHDTKIYEDLAGLWQLPLRGSWVGTLQQLNVLASPGRPIRVHPLVVKTQRIYLEGAKRFHEALDAPPDWIARTLLHWEVTLDAMERMDRAWLSARLDAFAKYAFYTEVLRDRGFSWEDLPNHKRLFYELALMDHSYHELGNDRSMFLRMERSGVLAHRIGASLPPGGEADPYVPEVKTRARARARFIKKHGDDDNLSIDWACVYHTVDKKFRRLDQPFAKSFGVWERNERDKGSVLRRIRETARQLTEEAEREIERRGERREQRAPF
jgi:hypothetical protein